MNVLVIENEKSKAKRIKELLQGIDESIRVVAVSENVTSAAEWLNRNTIPDIILANSILVTEIEKDNAREVKTTVTFSTPTEELNLRALRYKTVRFYLDGPWSPDDEPAISLQNHLLPPSPYKERFLVKQGHKFLSVSLDRIAYFFSEDRFIFFKTFDNQKFLLEYRIEQLEQVLSPLLFFRINRSLIISIPSVKEIHPWFGNRLKLHLSPLFDKEVIVSRKRVSSFKDWLGK